MSNLNEIKNFGPYMVRIMNEIGIFTKDDLLLSDYRKIRDELVVRGIKPHLSIFYSIEMGLQDRAWNDITPGEKREIQIILGSREQASKRNVK